jgi:hypothetical protein
MPPKHGDIAWKLLAKNNPTFLLAWRKVGWGFLNISVYQIGHFEEGQKIKSKWGEKLQRKLVLTKLVTFNNLTFKHHSQW